jgi:hypothetical protein
MTNPRFAVGDPVRLWKPGHAEHGAYGLVQGIKEYDGPPDRGPWTYMVDWTWRDGKGPVFRASLPDAMVIHEDEFNADT